MSSVKIIKCTVRESDNVTITGEVTYEFTFTETEVRLDLGFAATLSVLPANRLTTATKTGLAGSSNAKNGYRLVVSIPLKTVRPGGQAIVTRTDVFQVSKSSLFIDLTPSQVIAEQNAASTWGDPVWTKATAWNSIFAGLDATIELTPDFGGCRIDASDLRFLNRVVAVLPPAITTTARNSAVGGTGGTAFEDALPPGTLQMNRLIVSSATTVASIKAEWKTTSGLVMGTNHGSADLPSGNWYEFVFEPGEYITDISGQYGQGMTSWMSVPLPDGPTVVRWLQFTTNLNRKFGPFGGASLFGQSFSFTGLKVVGFFGRSGGALDQLGVISRTDNLPLPVVSATTQSPAPASPTALAFNGVDTYIEVNAALPITAQSTIEMWMRGVPKEAFLFFLTDANRRRQLSAHVPYSDGNVYFDSGADANNNYDRIVKAVTPIDDSTVWNHWAFVRNSASGRMAVYRNGALWHEQGTGLTRAMASCNRMVIAADGDGLWYHSGAISEIRLWNVERTAAQINDNMKRVIPGADTGLIASYSLDGYQAGQTLTDRSGGGRTGTVRGTAVSVAGPSTLLK